MAESMKPHRGSPPPNDGMAAARVAFPQTPEDFENDERVSYSKLDQKWILEEEDGQEWEFDEGAHRWIPLVDEALLEQQKAAYAIEGVDESAPAQPHKKRKATSADDSHGNGRPDKAKKSQHQSQPGIADRKNTAVYVTSLPLDASMSEVASVFSKCGVIAEEIDSGKPRIKMYRDSDDNFKGDALIVYFRPESVNLAVQMLDETDFRFGEQGIMGKMRVTEADRSYKKQQDKPDDDTASQEQTRSKAQKKGRSKDQMKIIRKTQKLNNKLADWSDDDTAAITETSDRYDKVVILKHMFTLGELEDDPAAILDIKEDIREECSKLGEVTNVVLMDLEPEGVVTVRFGNAEAARACVRMMDGRAFSGMKVEAYISDGNERFKKSGKKKGGILDDEADDNSSENEGEESRRLETFGKFLEENNQNEQQQDESASSSHRNGGSVYS